MEQMTKGERKTIKDLAEDDRPREKMLAKGKGSLSNAELIAILIGSGHEELTAVDLAREMLAESDDNLFDLSKRSIDELTQHKGIGKAKAVSIVAALELGRRCSLTSPDVKPSINNSKEAYEHLLGFINDFTQEHFLVAFLNQGNRIIKVEQVSTGGITSTQVDPKVIFKSALLKGATAIILCHNHPSGIAKPSTEDKQLTKKLIAAGKLLDINVIDHIIVGENCFYSFAENGLL